MFLKCTPSRCIKCVAMSNVLEVQELVREVKARGYKVALITNGHADIQRGKIEATQATAVLGGNILVGGEEIAAGRHEKPHVSIFHSACRIVNCLPNEVQLLRPPDMPATACCLMPPLALRTHKADFH